MKLTKAQRLFMKAGAADRKLRVCEKAFKQFCEEAKSNPHAWAGITSENNRLRAICKQLIRDALEDYETEKLIAQANAYERGFCAGRRINNTTKTQHT